MFLLLQKDSKCSETDLMSGRVVFCRGWISRSDFEPRSKRDRVDQKIFFCQSGVQIGLANTPPHIILLFLIGRSQNYIFL